MKLLSKWDNNKKILYLFKLGELKVQFTEDVCTRFKAYGWQVLKVEDGDNDLNAIANAIEEAKKDTTKPTLIYIRYIYIFIF